MTHTHVYAVPPAELLDALADPDYLAARHERFGGVGAPTAQHVDDQVVITALRQLPMDKIPSAIKGLVGDGQITQIDTWSSQPDGDSVLRGTWRADLGTAPTDIGGEYSIEPIGDGCSYACTVNVKVKVPFVGGKIEQQVLGYLDRLITKEQAFLADWFSKG